MQSSLSIDTKWNQNGVTIAGGNEKGKELNQLHFPWGIDVDHDQTIYVADMSNHRIIAWKKGATTGEIVADRNGLGNENHQLCDSINVIVDHHNDALIVADYGNKRVVRYPRQNDQQSQIIISNVLCSGLAMDNNGDLYVCDEEKDEVRRCKIGENEGILVAGGNGRGDRLNQFNQPRFIFVDNKNESVYISDYMNNRVMKWMKNAKEGVVVAGDQSYGHSLTQLRFPRGIFVDQLETVYVTDAGNHRIICWLKGSNEGEIVVGGNADGDQPNQFFGPVDLSFDKENNLYVLDYGNNRVQKFSIIENN